MGRVEAFEVPGCRCWMYTGDHDAPHFHASSPDDWEVRIYFLEDPVMHDVIFKVRHLPARTLRELLHLAEDHRAELFEQWSRSVADD